MKRGKLICIVDDNSDYRSIIYLFLKRSCPEHSVCLFEDGSAFLEALPEMSQPPSLILLDHHMPRLNGYQTLNFLRQLPGYKRIPVVMMSADASREEIDACYDSGVNSFLKKNIGATDTHDILSTICHYWLEMNLEPEVASCIERQRDTKKVILGQQSQR